MYTTWILLNKKIWGIVLIIPIVVFSLYLITDVLPYWDVLTGPEIYTREKNYTHKSHTIMFILNWSIINFNAAILSLIFPLLITIGLIDFKEDLNTYFVLGRQRFSHYFGAVSHAMLLYSAMITIAITAGHAFVYIIFSWITPLKDDLLLGSTAYIFNFMLPSDFFKGQPLLYFLATVLINDIPIMFSYSLFFSVCTLYIRKNLYLFVLFPILFMIAGTLIAQNFQFPYSILEIPFSGYYSQITNIWKYTLIPLVPAIIGMIGYLKLENRLWPLLENT